MEEGDEERIGEAERASERQQRRRMEENERAGGVGGMEAGFPGRASREPEMSSRDPGFAG